MDVIVLQKTLFLGLWPYAVRQIVASLCAAKCVCVNVERVSNLVVGSVSWVESSELCVVLLFCVSAKSGWGGRVARFLMEYWSVMVGAPTVIGGVFADYPQLGSLLTEGGLHVPIEVKSVVLEEIVSLVSSGVMTLFGGQTVGAVLGYLFNKLRGHLTETFFEDCPTLMQVSMIVNDCQLVCDRDEL